MGNSETTVPIRTNVDVAHSEQFGPDFLQCVLPWTVRKRTGIGRVSAYPEHDAQFHVHDRARQEDLRSHHFGHRGAAEH